MATRIGITGHRDLTPTTVELVASALTNELARYDPVVGVSCLAEGADQLFAHSLLDRGGILEVIVPSLDYREHMSAENKADYDKLIERAVRVTQLPYPGSTPCAHMAASLVMVERSDVLFAVWDRLPARSFAGTADVVEYAGQLAVPVVVIWPPRSARATSEHH